MRLFDFNAAASAILTKYHRYVLREACRIIPFPDLADDVAQQTFVDFLAKAGQWDLWSTGKDARPLLKTMVQRCARKAWQERAKMLPESLQKLGRYVQQGLSESDTGEDERLQTLQSCMQKMSESERQLIMRYYFDGIPTKQIAEELQKNPDTVSKAIYRIRDKLRLCVEQTLKAEKQYD